MNKLDLSKFSNTESIIESFERQDKEQKLKQELFLLDKEKQKYSLGNLAKKGYEEPDLEKKEFLECKNEIISCFLQKERQRANEKAVEFIKKRNRIYTIRDDDKPELWIYRDGIYQPNGKTYIKNICRLLFGEAYTTHLANVVVEKIQTDTYIDPNDFFVIKDIYKIPVLNGILNLKTKELEPFSPHYFFFNKLPIIYDPDKKPETIIKFFNDILKDQNDINVLQELFGYLLLRDYKFEKAFMFLGDGRNGKGKTIELMKRFIGAENCANISLIEIEKNSFALSQLHNKMANLSADLSKHALVNTGNFKTLTGHDLISADRKFQTRVNFVNYAKMIFACNELPTTHDITTAFFNRWLLIDFPFTFVSKEEYDKLPNKNNYKIADRQIIEKISTEDELTGLLNFALEGLNRLLERQSFSSSTSTEETKKRWLRKSNSLNAFYMDCIKEDFESWIGKDNFKEVYVDYCRIHKLNIASDKEIKQSLEMQGIIDGRITSEGVQFRVWKGINFDLDQSFVDKRKAIRQGRQERHGF